MASQVVLGVIPWIVESGFFLAVSWRLNQLPWWWDFIIAALITLILDRGLHRKYSRVQVALQLHRSYVSGALVLLLVGASVLSLPTHSPRALLASLQRVDLCLGALAVILGHVIRRTAGHASAPGLVQSAARRPKSELFGVLMIATLAAPSWSWGSLSLYVAGIACGVAVHWWFREYEYFRADKRRRSSIACAVLDELPKAGWDALGLYARGHLTHAKKLLKERTDTRSQLIAAMIEYERGMFAEALMILGRIKTDDDRRQAANVQALIARVHFAHGDEKEASEALCKAEELDSDCPIVAIATVTLCDAEKKPGASDVDELLKILNMAGAHGRSTSMDEYLVNIAYDVNPAFFYDALALCLLRKGHLHFAEEVIARAVRSAPRYAVARLHQGVIFAARRDQIEVRTDHNDLATGEQAELAAAERSELAEVARIAFELAIRLSPDHSVTAKRARKQLDKLGRRVSEELAF